MQRFIQTFFATDRSTTQLVLRLAAGGLFLPHGLQKVFGAFGGYGFEGTMGFLTGSLGIPYPVALLVILAESVGAFLLLSGTATRLWAGLLAATMVGAIATLHGTSGFFMTSTGVDGYEYNLALLAITGLLVAFGGGRWSVDGLIAERLTPAEEQPVALRRAA